MADDRGVVGKIVTSFFEGIGEVTRGAMDDIRHQWERAWFGREVTPESVDRLAESLDWLEETGKDVKTSWDAMCAELAKQRGYEPERGPERDMQQDVDR